MFFTKHLPAFCPCLHFIHLLRVCDGLLLQVMRKEKILQNDYADYVRSERDVLTSVSHPYIVTLRFSFQVCSTLRLAPCSPHSCCSEVSHHKA